jgi:endonuclease YncB( thermonuclease family)
MTMKRLALALILAACATPASAQPVTSIYWHDGDSGRVNGQDFRLADVDAPETGGVGSINGARCEAEREAGFVAKAWIVEATRGKQLVITGGDAKPDKWGRRVLTLSVDGADLGALAVASGRLKPYVFENGRAKTKKPGWC